MISVDTSVWIAFLRRADPHIVDVLGSLLEDDAVSLPAPVRLELVGGTRAGEQRHLASLLDALLPLQPGATTWSLAESWALDAAARGQRFGATDLLIGALAAERGHRLWSLDRDFERLAALGYVQAFGV